MFKKILALAPHPDDCEFSCGGTIKKLTLAGAEVHYITFSPCTKSVPKGYSKDVLFNELFSAAEKLGVSKSNITTFDFPVRELDKHRQEILEELVKIRNSFQPELVLLPDSSDVHQDHQVIHNEGKRAFKHTCMIGYELPWNSFSFKNTFYSKLEKQHLDAKIAAIGTFQSQQFRNYSSADFFYGLARVRGVQINCEFAEAFEVIRWVI